MHICTHFESMASRLNLKGNLLCCRWGNTPFDEARLSGNNQLIKLLEEAKSAQTSEIHSVSHEISGIAEATPSLKAVEYISF